jgi:hypothetical protein
MGDDFRQDEILCLLGQSALLRFTEDLDDETCSATIGRTSRWLST